VKPSDKRLDERYCHEVEVDLLWNKQRVRLATADVSYRGLFLRTDTPPSLRQLLRLEIELEDGVLALHGMAVHVVPPPAEGDHGPGVGVQFYAVDRDAASRWGRYVDRVRKMGGRPSQPRGVGPSPTALISRSAVPEIAALISADARATAKSGDDAKVPVRRAPPPLPIPAPVAVQAPMPRVAPPPLPSKGSLKKPTPTPTRRKFPRFDAELELEVQSMNQLRTLLTRDVSAGGMFIATDAPFDAGTRLRICVKHPVHEEDFELAAVVKRRLTAPAGVGVEFTNLDTKRRSAFIEFIRSSLPMEEILVVDPKDPSLA